VNAMLASRLYEAFSRYPRPDLRRAEGNGCSRSDGVAEEIDAELRAKPLTELSDADLLDYYYLAVTHVGTIEGFKHYLPRILELMASVRRPLLSVRLLASRLRDAEFASWPPIEREVVLEFCRSAPAETRLPRVAEELST